MRQNSNSLFKYTRTSVREEAAKWEATWQRRKVNNEQKAEGKMKSKKKLLNKQFRWVYKINFYPPFFNVVAVVVICSFLSSAVHIPTHCVCSFVHITCKHLTCILPLYYLLSCAFSFTFRSRIHSRLLLLLLLLLLCLWMHNFHRVYKWKRLAMHIVPSSSLSSFELWLS